MSMPDELPLLRFAVLTLFPEMFEAITRWGVTGRAFQAGLWQLHLQDPREEATDRHGSVDDRPYGGGPGMVMQAPILSASLAKARRVVGEDAKVIALSPQGRKLDVELVKSLLGQQDFVLVAGRYEGIDERFISHHVDLEVSLGDFVVSGRNACNDAHGCHDPVVAGRAGSRGLCVRGFIFCRPLGLPALHSA